MKRPGFQKMLTAIEAGYISAVFVKDLSRLGRNYIEVGKLTEEFFPLHDIRLVAVSDGVDSDEGEDDFTPFKNIMNEYYAKLRRYAEQAGYTIVGVAAEHGSGLTLDRPALQELTEAVLAGKVDVVLVNSLDRLGRDWGMTKQYIDLLTEHKVKLLCVRERMMIDSSSFSPFFT